MKLIPAAKPELWRQGKGFIGMCEHIARCAAICYNSTPKTGDEAVDFVRRLIKMGHGRALEFGTFRANITDLDSEELYIIAHRCHLPWLDLKINGNGWSIATNLRLLIENDLSLELIESWTDKIATDNHLEGDCEQRITIHYPAISRAIADEFRTHTTLSTLMQSTRYVNAASKGDVEFIEPFWFRKADDEQQANFICALNKTGQCYADAVGKLGMKRQEARDMLPLCVKTEMVQCGSPMAWRNLIKLRSAKDAHPDAREMAQILNTLRVLK